MKNKISNIRNKRGKEGPVPENLGKVSSRKKTDQSRISKLRTIGIDQPFDYEEVIKVTGPEYVLCLHHDGVMFTPYEELKRNPPVPHVARRECIWMKARIINFRLCDYDGDCDHCEFDLNMRRAMGDECRPGRTTPANDWPDQVRENFETVARPCIYFLLGRPGAPVDCKERYECFSCPVYEKQHAGVEQEPMAGSTFVTASGYKLAEGRYYHMGHSWARMEKGGYARLGIDDFAAKVFGKVSTFQLPEVGASLRQGEVGLVLFRNGDPGPIQSPLSGRVVAVNTQVIEDPSICREDCYQTGWLILIEPYYLKNELKSLYFGRESVAWMERENRLLLESLGPEYERLAATGGEPAEDLFDSLPGADWASLVRRILRTGVKR
jgi:glycine cleavage system H lipoate-binding protein